MCPHILIHVAIHNIQRILKIKGNKEGKDLKSIKFRETH